MKRYETTHNRKGYCHLNEIGTLAFQPLTYTIDFSRRIFLRLDAIFQKLFKHVENVTTTCDSYRFFRIVTDGIAEGLILDDVVTRRKLKSCGVRPAYSKDKSWSCIKEFFDKKVHVI